MRYKFSLILLILCLVMVMGCMSEKNAELNDDDLEQVEHAPNDGGLNEHDNQDEPNELNPPELENEPNEPVLDPIAEQIKQMTLQDKIGQMVLVGIEGTKVTERTKKLIETYRVGGLILFKRNIDDAAQTLQLLNALKKVNAERIPLFLSVDQEGGRVNRLPELVQLPSSQTIGAANDESLSFNVGEILGEQLDAFGLNMNYAPVLDIYSNQSNTVIGDRAFGSTAEIVQKHGLQVMKGIQSQHVIPVVKHFPGHGDTFKDSHIDMPVVDKSIEELSTFEWLPFKKAIKNEVDVIMISHILLSQIDANHPATLSKAIMTEVLRKDLGFSGVIITDDMTMGAITKHYELGEAAVLAVNAGNDIIMVAHGYDNAVSTIKSLEQAVEAGIIAEATINDSVQRILQLKHQYNLTNEVVEHIDLETINAKANDIIKIVNNATED